MLAEVSVRLLDGMKSNLFAEVKARRGVYHLAGGGSVSRLQWAKKILQHDPHPEEQKAKTILGVRSAEFPTPAKRPLYTVLDCKQFQNSFNVKIPPWDESLRLAMNEPF
jgi:dTDP-4-dehydrorhamnose reductase